MESLPATAYIKMMDIWMILMMLFPFLIVFLLTIRELFKNRNACRRESQVQSIERKDRTVQDTTPVFLPRMVMSNTDAVQRVNFLLNWGLPVIILLFSFSYWLFGMLYIFLGTSVGFC